MAGSRHRVPRLHVVTTREVLERGDFVAAARRLLENDSVAVHLRARTSSRAATSEERDDGRLLLDLAADLAATAPAGALLVNDRVDVARIAGLGAHLPELGLTPTQARLILGAGPLLGRSLHRIRQVEELSPADDLDYVVYGNVFATASKPGAPGVGLDDLRRAARAARSRRVPLVAIGGISVERVPEVVAGGAYGVAVVSGVWESGDPVAAAESYLSALCAAPQEVV